MENHADSEGRETAPQNHEQEVCWNCNGGGRDPMTGQCCWVCGGT